MRNIGSTKEVLKRAEAERLKPKAKPVISIGRKKPSIKIEVDSTNATKSLNILIESAHTLKEDLKQKLIREIIIEENKLRVERNILSSQIWKMVENGATPGELKTHYEKIESSRIPLQQLWDRKRYVEVHGVLPEDQTSTPTNNSEASTSNVLELKDRKRKLSDLRCKLNKKLQPSAKPSRPEQIIDWQMQLDKADAEYHQVEEQIKQLQLK